MPLLSTIETTRYNLYQQRSQRYLSLFDADYQTTHNKNILELTALKKVVKGKLKYLVNDPRSYSTLKDEIIRTEKDLYAINHAILQEVLGDEMLQDIKNRLSYQRSGNNALKFFYNMKDIKVTVNISSINTRDYLNTDEEIKLKILNDLFFTDKKNSITKRLILNEKANVDIFQKEAELEYAQKMISFNNTKNQYWMSRVGKLIAANYAISQVVSLGFMCAVILIALYPIIVPALLTGIWFIPLTYFAGGTLIIAWFMNGTGRINWDGCRDSVPNMLIEFWNMFFNKTDIGYTKTQKIRLFATFIECAICGAVSGFFVDYIIIAALVLLFGESAAILTFAPMVTIPLAVFAALNMFLFMYKFSSATILRGILQDIKIFFKAIFATDLTKIEALKRELIADYQQRYQHIYNAEALAAKVTGKFDDSILGIILNFNDKAIKEESFVGSIYFRAFAILFAAFVCAPLIIVGIIYGQLSAYQGLAIFLDGFMDFAKEASKLLCFFSGTAYTSSFTYFTVKSAAKSLYVTAEKEVSQKQAVEMNEIEDDPNFPQRRLANSMDNGSQTAYGYVDSRRKEQENGELESLGNAVVNVVKDPGMLAGFFVFTGAASLASYVFASAPEKSKDYNQTLKLSAKKLTTAYENTKKRHVTEDSSAALVTLQTKQTEGLTSSIISSFAS